MSLVAITTLRDTLNAVGITTTSVSDESMTMIEAQSASLVESYLDRTLAITTHTEYYDIYDYQDTIFLNNFPIQNIAALTNDSVLVASADYLSYSDDGVIKLTDRVSLLTARSDRTPYFSEGKRMVWITYQAGFTVIPYDIQGVITNLVARRLEQSGMSSMMSERIGDYSYSRMTNMPGSSGGFTMDELMILNKYKPVIMMEDS